MAATAGPAKAASNFPATGQWVEEYADDALAAARAVMRQHQRPTRRRAAGRNTEAVHGARTEHRAAARQRAAVRQQAAAEAAKVHASRISTNEVAHAQQVGALREAATEAATRERNRMLLAPLADARSRSGSLLSRAVHRDRPPECWPADSYSVYMVRQAGLREGRAAQQLQAKASRASQVHRAATCQAERGAAAAQTAQEQEQTRRALTQSYRELHEQSLADGKSRLGASSGRVVDYSGCGQSTRVGHYEFKELDTPAATPERLSPKQVKDRLSREAERHRVRRERVTLRGQRLEREVVASMMERCNMLFVSEAKPGWASVVCSVRPEADGCVVELSHDPQHDAPETDGEDRPVPRQLVVVLKQPTAALVKCPLGTAEDWISGETLAWAGLSSEGRAGAQSRLVVSLPVGGIRYLRCSLECGCARSTTKFVSSWSDLARGKYCKPRLAPPGHRPWPQHPPLTAATQSCNAR